MKKFISSILVVFLLLLSSCVNKDYFKGSFKAGVFRTNEVHFVSEDIKACSPILLLDNISLKKYNIDYLFICWG